MRRNLLKNKKKMRISFQPVDNPDKVNTHLLSWLLAACSMIGPFATDMYLPSFHQMAQAFGSDLAGVQMTLSSYLAGFAVMTLFYGTISDMFGRKLTMVTGFLCFSASSLGAATSDSLSMLVLWRLCQGIFAGCGMVIGMAVIRDLFGGPKAQMLMAYVSMVFGFGPALAPVIGGIVATHLSWESHFYILTFISAVLAALCLLFLPETLPKEKRMSPRLGTLLSNYASAARHGAFMTANTALAVAFLGQGVFIAGAADWCVEVMHLSPDEFWKLFLPMVSGAVIGSWISARIAGRLSHTRNNPSGLLRDVCRWRLCLVYHVGLVARRHRLGSSALDDLHHRHRYRSSGHGPDCHGLLAAIPRSGRIHAKLRADDFLCAVFRIAGAFALR